MSSILPKNPRNFFQDFCLASKGQIISKRLLVPLDSSKKQMNKFFFLPNSTLKPNLFDRFLEESENIKKSFQNYLTFSHYYNHLSVCHISQRTSPTLGNESVYNFLTVFYPFFFVIFLTTFLGDSASCKTIAFKYVPNHSTPIIF